MTANSTVFQSVAVADPDDPENVIKPNADGSINVTGSFSATTTAKATADPPSYSEGEDAPISQTLDGGLRISGSITASTSAHATAAPPSYVEGSDDDLSMNLTGDLRTIAKQNGTWTVGLSAGSALVGKVGIDQTTPGTTNAVAATNFPAAVDVNSGNKSSSTIRVVLATDQPTLTNAQPVSQALVAVTVTDKGGTISSGGTAQTAIASNGSRKNAFIQNPVEATENLYVSVTGSATVGGAGNFADLAPGGSVTLLQNGQIITAAVSVNAATTSHRFYAAEMT